METKAIDATQLLKTIDLTALRTQLQEMEGDLELLVREKQKEIDALKLLIKTADVFQNGKPKIERKPRQQKPAGTGSPTGGPTIKERALTFLEAAGPSTASQIAKNIGCQPPSVYAILDDSRFKKNPNGTISLA